MKKTASIVMPVMKQRKKNTETDPLFVDPPDNAYSLYFKEFESKRAPNFTAVEDLVLCKAYTAGSENRNVGINQTAEILWGNVFERFVLLSGCEVVNGMFYKNSSQSLKDR